MRGKADTAGSLWLRLHRSGKKVSSGRSVARQRPSARRGGGAAAGRRPLDRYFCRSSMVVLGARCFVRTYGGPCDRSGALSVRMCSVGSAECQEIRTMIGCSAAFRRSLGQVCVAERERGKDEGARRRGARREHTREGKGVRHGV